MGFQIQSRIWKHDWRDIKDLGAFAQFLSRYILCSELALGDGLVAVTASWFVGVNGRRSQRESHSSKKYSTTDCWQCFSYSSMEAFIHSGNKSASPLPEAKGFENLTPETQLEIRTLVGNVGSTSTGRQYS